MATWLEEYTQLKTVTEQKIGSGPEQGKTYWYAGR